MAPDNMDYEGILLAAGRSHRMCGIDKRLLVVDGMAMVRRSARLYRDLGMPLTVVIGTGDGAIARELADLDVALVVNADPDAGQNTSVLAGLTATPLTGAGIVVALADQPLLTGDDIRALLAVFAVHGGTRICVPRLAGVRGNPVIFPVAVARRLRTDTMPPRKFIDANPDLIGWFDAANDHFTRDIDTREDAARLSEGVANP